MCAVTGVDACLAHELPGAVDQYTHGVSDVREFTNSSGRGAYPDAGADTSTDRDVNVGIVAERASEN